MLLSLISLIQKQILNNEIKTKKNTLLIYILAFEGHQCQKNKRTKYFFVCFSKKWLFWYNFSYPHLKFWIFGILKNFGPLLAKFLALTSIVIAFIQARLLRGKGASILVLTDQIIPHSDILHEFSQMEKPYPYPFFNRNYSVVDWFL